MIDTETKIKNAATDLLLKDGNFGLSMADIAEKSEVSRTVINYYFRSKENLLSIVDKEIISNIVVPKYSVLLAEDSLLGKIDKYINQSEVTSKLFPFLDVYIMSQYENNLIFQDYFKSIAGTYKDLLSQIQLCIEERKLNYLTPDCFLADLFTLTNCSFIYSKFFTSNHHPLDKTVKTDTGQNRKKNILKYFFTNKI